jgi:hypothetical protein
MRTEPSRKFTLFDGMVFVAATAVAFASYPRSPLEYFPAFLEQIREAWSRNPSLHGSLFSFLVTLEYIFWLPQMVLAFWTLALVGLRLLPPRPRLRRLARQPGTIASCVASSVLLIVEISLALILLATLRTNSPQQHIWFYVMSGDGFRVMTAKVGFAVAAAWLTLALSGRWRAEPDWVDRMGRFMGAFWIGLIPFYNWVITRG